MTLTADSAPLMSSIRSLHFVRITTIASPQRYTMAVMDIDNIFQRSTIISSTTNLTQIGAPTTILATSFFQRLGIRRGLVRIAARCGLGLNSSCSWIQKIQTKETKELAIEQWIKAYPSLARCTTLQLPTSKHPALTNHHIASAISLPPPSPVEDDDIVSLLERMIIVDSKDDITVFFGASHQPVASVQAIAAAAYPNLEFVHLDTTNFENCVHSSEGAYLRLRNIIDELVIMQRCLAARYALVIDDLEQYSQMYDWVFGKIFAEAYVHKQVVLVVAQ
ncbi:uncharacterized protein V1518DRAFT_423108 [Limtongia smithiae]|uniref:uncharacterized protein n=1 Tax=Limtongia smithiae TaxID=1125753 RepID=UPI0034CD1285